MTTSLGDEGTGLLSCVYTQNAEMIRHFDRLKYTGWTVYTLIIAGLWVAKKAGEISSESMIIVSTVASIYFILLTSRIQKNYKTFYASAYSIEQKVRALIESVSPAQDLILPFDAVAKHAKTKFWEINVWDRIVGCVPYFHLKISFFFMIPVGMVLLYHFN